jgi:hypothetical protein
MIRFFIQPLVLLAAVSGLSLGFVVIEDSMGILDPYTTFSEEFRFSFRVYGCCAGILYSFYTFLLRLPLLSPIVYWCAFIMAAIFLPVLVEHIASLKQKKREKLLRNALEKASLFCSEMTADGYFKGVAANIFADELDELIQCFLYGDAPPSEYERNIMSVLKVYTKIMRSGYYGFKHTSGIRVSKDSKPGKEIN